MLQASWGRRGNHQQEQDSPNLGTAFQRFPVIPTCPIWKACSEKNTLVHNLTVACTLHKSLLITVKSDTPRDKTISPLCLSPFPLSSSSISSQIFLPPCIIATGDDNSKKEKENKRVPLLQGQKVHLKVWWIRLDIAQPPGVNSIAFIHSGHFWDAFSGPFSGPFYSLLFEVETCVLFKNSVQGLFWALL